MQDSGTLQRRVLAATSISYVLVILDTSIVNVALPRIAAALDADIAGLQWVVNAYTLVFAALLLTGGTLGDRWGARRVYLAGLAVFTLASAACGAVPSPTILTLARTLQGVGAALLVPCSLTLLNQAYPDAGDRARAIGIWAGCGGVAMAAGPLIGGVLVDLFGWRSIFLVNVPIGLAGIALTRRLPGAKVGDDGSGQPRPLDLAGQFTVILALGCLVGALIEAPALGWASPSILAGLAVSVFAWAAFMTIEAQRSQPMLPLAFFCNRLFTASVVVSMASAFTSYGLIFVLSLYFQQVRGYAPLWAGLAFLPLTGVVTAGSVIAGRLVKAFGARWPVMMGLGLCILGLLGLLPSITDAAYWLVALPLPAIGFGVGLITPAATAALIGTVAPPRSGIAAGVLNAGRQTGAALGVAVSGAMVAALHPFAAGLRAGLWVGIATLFAAAILWLWASAKKPSAAEADRHPHHWERRC